VGFAIAAQPWRELGRDAPPCTSEAKRFLIAAMMSVNPPSSAVMSVRVARSRVHIVCTAVPPELEIVSGFTVSTCRRGNCWDNADSKTLLGSLKLERLYGQRFVTRR
jgi:hypothetical protein